MSGPVAITKRCPICGKPAEQKFRPFCSRRCREVDLHRWFSGVYAIPAAEDDEWGEADAAGTNTGSKSREAD